MSEGKTNLFYVFGTILVLLSLSIIGNCSISASSADVARQTMSTAFSGIIMPGVHSQGSLYDTFCYMHNQYFGLRY